MKSVMYTLFCAATAMIGYTIHGDIFWSFVDFFFAPAAWVYWLITHEVTASVIRHSFQWFFN